MRTVCLNMKVNVTTTGSHVNPKCRMSRIFCTCDAGWLQWGRFGPSPIALSGRDSGPLRPSPLKSRANVNLKCQLLCTLSLYRAASKRNHDVAHSFHVSANVNAAGFDAFRATRSHLWGRADSWYQPRESGGLDVVW